MKNKKKILGQNIRHLRIGAGVKQHDLGAVIGVTAQQIGKYEKGTSHINAVYLADIAAALCQPIQRFYYKL